MKNSRRNFLKHSITAAVAGSALSSFNCKASAKTEKAAQSKFEFTQIKLPYSFNALEPYIDAQTMEIHYGKHHAAYVKNASDALLESQATYTSENELFKSISQVTPKLRNNAGGVYNHNFFWTCMRPGDSSNLMPAGKALEAINNAFGGVEKFKEQFAQTAMSRFGSGWAWLVSEQGKLKIGSTPNQDNPLMDVSELKGTPILALDVWEHAYYLKYQNKRNEYVANWWNLVNWDEVSRRLS